MRFSIAYNSERKHRVFALALRVPHGVCEEHKIAVLAHGYDGHDQRVARNSNANRQRLRLLLFAILKLSSKVQSHTGSASTLDCEECCLQSEIPVLES